MLSTLISVSVVSALTMVGGCYFLGWYASAPIHDLWAKYKGILSGIVAFIGFVLCCVCELFWRKPPGNSDVEVSLKVWLSGEFGTLIIIGLVLLSMGVGALAYRLAYRPKPAALD